MFKAKKLLAIVLAMLMVFSILPVSALAESVDASAIVSVAEDFEDINVTGTEGAYKEIPNQPFGKALWFGRSTDAVDATITFDE
ncbi:MAG: hypothetical protein IJO76_05305, partial [Clostridia bacterium]|nr:hypothetical protein [Clostridia bacterium]